MNKIRVIFLLFFSCAVSANQQTSFPMELIGKWSPKIENCAAEFRWVDEGVSAVRNMVISKEGVMFWESQGTPTSIIKSGKNFVVNLNMLGEGETWSVMEAFILTKDSKKLSRKVGSRITEYFRCEK